MPEANTEQHADDGADHETALPAAQQHASGALDLGSAFGDNLPPSLRILLDPNAFERCKALATMMANAKGFTPPHLVGQPAACHVVINMALDTKLSPQFVARNTYSTPGGAIGFQGVLVQAILNQSGRLKEPVSFEYHGDWAKLAGKFQMVDVSKGKYPRATWTDADAVGLGIRVRAWLRNEREPRFWPSKTEWFQLVQCQPRNSPLWATDPRTQIGYLAVRRFANQATPELLGGMAFDVDELLDAADQAIDVTPQQAQETGGQHRVVSEEPWIVFHANGDPFQAKNADIAFEAAKRIFTAAAKQDRKTLETAWENNAALIERFAAEDDKHGDEELSDLYRTLLAELPPAPDPAPEDDAAEHEEEPADESTGSASPNASDPGDPPGHQAGPSAHDHPAEQENHAQGGTAPSTDTAERHDPFWDGRSLRIDPPAARGKVNTLDWKMWPALILPKIRAAYSTAILNELFKANEENFRLYGEAAGDRSKDEILFEVDLARERLAKAAAAP